VSRQRELADGLAGLGLSVTGEHQAPLLAFVDLLLKWNRKVNLVSRGDESRIVPRHLLDSLVLQTWLRGQRVADLGSGAGLPGIPLAIVEPERAFTLVDRSERRTRFVRQVVIELGLDNVDVITGDAASYRSATGFDTVTSRAVDHPATMWRLARPLFAAAGGRALLQCGEQHHDARFDAAYAAQFLSTFVPGLDRSHYLWVVDGPAV
jgi:16S rRNA (guanine527-N7)-methyltransferase